MKRYDKKIEGLYQVNEYVAVINDETKKTGLFAFTDERSALKFISKVENISDITLFQTDYYGKAERDEIENYYSNSKFYDLVYVNPVPSSINKNIKNVMSLLRYK